MAHFPFQRTLEQFDFAFQPSIDERQVKELASLAFVAEAVQRQLLLPVASIILAGSPPVLDLAVGPHLSGSWGHQTPG